MDNIFKTLDELEAVVENSRGDFMGKRLINEEEFFTRVQQLRAKLNALSTRQSRDALSLALSLPREERRKLAEALLRD